MSSPRLRLKRGASGILIEKQESRKVTQVSTTSRPGPLSKKSNKDINKAQILDKNDEKLTRVQRFIREMKESKVRDKYVETVDKHVDKLLESVRDRRPESLGRGKRGSNFSSRKPSQATQIAETTKRIDLSSADSILGHVKNPRLLLNPTSFASLPLFYQYKLVKLLPACDQLTGNSGWVKPSAFSLTNEFFTKACSEWCESLKEGKFSSEILTRKRMEIEKEKSKLDAFKLKHFEPVWGAKLESAIDHRSEYDRIPRTVEFLISPTSFFTQPISQPPVTAPHEDDSLLLQESMQTQSDVNPVANGSSDETDIDNDVSDSTESETRNQTSLSPQIDKPLKSILKKPKRDCIQNGIIVECVLDTPVVEVTPVTPEKIQSPPLSNNSSQFKIPDISITPIIASSDQTQFPIDAPSKKVRICSDVCKVPATTTSSIVPTSITVHELIDFPSDESTSKIRKIDSPVKGCNSDQFSRRTRTPPRNKSGKNSQGVDEMRSLLICKEAVEKSINNKLFYAQNGKIRSLNAPVNHGVQQGSSTTCNGSNMEFLPEMCDGNQLSQKLFNDVEITPVSSEVKSEPQNLGDSSKPIEITVQDFTGKTETVIKPSILSSYLSQRQITSLQDSSKLYDSSHQDQISLPYKIPNGITITPFTSESSLSQVPVITHGSVTNRQMEAQDLVRFPSQITVIPLGVSNKDSLQPIDNTSNGPVRQSNLSPNQVHQTMICDEVAQHNLMAGQPGTMLSRNDICACDGKAFTPCAACGSFCHSDCIGPSRLCVNCLVRVNSYNTNPQALSVISAPSNPASGQTTAYFYT